MKTIIISMFDSWTREYYADFEKAMLGNNASIWYGWCKQKLV